jgi:hypothetical protein
MYRYLYMCVALVVVVPALFGQPKPQYQTIAPASHQQQAPEQPRLNRHQESDERVPAAH